MGNVALVQTVVAVASPSYSAKISLKLESETRILPSEERRATLPADIDIVAFAERMQSRIDLDQQLEPD